MLLNNHNYKSNFKEGIQNIHKMHSAGASGFNVAFALSRLYDNLLVKIFQTIVAHNTNVAIVALGGYGRKELCFSSDLDIMFLILDETQREISSLFVHEYLHKLMDIGLKVGHSYRTIDECLNLPKDDFESQISLLETRFICGNVNIYKIFSAKIFNKIKEENYSTFVKRLTESKYLRHSKYGNSSNLLEPNIKNSAGGLRDIHTAFWLMRGTGAYRLPDKLKPNETAILNFLNSSSIQKHFTSAYIKDIKSSFNTLLRIRNEMHLQSKSLHDTLEFGFQSQVATGLNYRSKLKRSKVEHFMQDYFAASRLIALFCAKLFEWANDFYLVDEKNPVKKKRFGDFIIYGRRIYFKKKNIRLSNVLLLQALLLRSEHNAEFSFSFEDIIHRQLRKLKPLKSRFESDLFRILLHRPNGVASSLNKMNELGLLEIWIPEWKPMVSFFQHNQYHFYTADEHTLISIINAESLGHSNSTFGKVFRMLPRRDTLYLACLLHDIAKPKHIGKHEIKGVRIAKQVLKRINYLDVVDDVAFLVRYHLLMEQTAFRRNLNDPQTIIDFAHLFNRVEQLDYLYVLTYADLSAVNRNVLTEWKEILLWDLYQKARAVIEKEMTSDELKNNVALQIESNRAVAFRYLVPEFPPEEVEEHLSLLQDTSYLSIFKSEDIENHLRIIRRKEPITVVFQKSGNYTDITFITRDAQGVLSKLCGVLTANDVNILDAQIFTRKDGIVIDKFRTIDFVTRSCLSEDICRKISSDTINVISGNIELTRLINKHHIKWKRRTTQPNPNIQYDVKFEDHPQYTIIDIYAPDMLGFLYRVTQKISELGLNISFAKIATRVDGIVDSFYVLDGEARKIDNLEKREYIKQEILTLIRNLCNSQVTLSTT